MQTKIVSELKSATFIVPLNYITCKVQCPTRKVQCWMAVMKEGFSNIIDGTEFVYMMQTFGDQLTLYAATNL